MERLLLGYALPGKNERLFGKTLPYDHVEGSDALILGRFCEYTEKLFSYVARLEQPRTLKEWSILLTELIEALFFPDEDSEREMQVIRTGLTDLERLQEMATFDEKCFAIVVSIIASGFPFFLISPALRHRALAAWVFVTASPIILCTS